MELSTCIIGVGRLGSALAMAFHKQNNLKYLVDVSDIARQKIKTILLDFNNVLSDLKSIDELPQFIFLTVNDDLIELTAEYVANNFCEKIKGKYIIHCSGSMPVKILDSCKQCGAFTASIHPYQTFYHLSDDLLQGIAWSIRSDYNTEIIKQLIEQIGGIPYVINDDDDTLSFYHSSAVVASNFMTALISLAREMASLANIDGNSFMPPIIKTTIENSFNSQEFPLTGPYARGDLKTIKRHLDSLSPYPELKRSYVYMALATLEQIRFHKSFDDEIVSEMRAILLKTLNSELE